MQQARQTFVKPLLEDESVAICLCLDLISVEMNLNGSKRSQFSRGLLFVLTAGCFLDQSASAEVSVIVDPSKRCRSIG